jgi:hypothetical protein
VQLLQVAAIAAMARQHGTGRIYIKWGAFYGRWRTLDGRYVNRRLGRIRRRGSSEGLSRTEADRLLRRPIEVETARPATEVDARPRTVDEVADELRDRLSVQGARLSYRQNCESMQRVHISPVLGTRRVDKRQDVERLARVMTLAELVEELELSYPEKVAGFERRFPDAMAAVADDDLAACDPDELHELASDLRNLLRV